MKECQSWNASIAGSPLFELNAKAGMLAAGVPFFWAICYGDWMKDSFSSTTTLWEQHQQQQQQIIRWRSVGGGWLVENEAQQQQAAAVGASLHGLTTPSPKFHFFQVAAMKAWNLPFLMAIFLTLEIRVILKVTWWSGGQNGQFQHNRASNA